MSDSSEELVYLSDSDNTSGYGYTSSIWIPEYKEKGIAEKDDEEREEDKEVSIFCERDLADEDSNQLGLKILTIRDELFRRPSEELLRRYIADVTRFTQASGTYIIAELVEVLGFSDAWKYLECLTEQSWFYVRANTLKINAEVVFDYLKEICVPLRIPWAEVGFLIPTTLRYQPEKLARYKAGEFTMIEPCKFYQLRALDPQKDEIVVDVWPQDGGLVTYMAAVMENTGEIYAIVRPELAGEFSRNAVERMGVSNMATMTTNLLKENGCDRAIYCPYTASGYNVTSDATKASIVRQNVEGYKRELLRSIDAVDADSESGGCIVYSTTSFLVEENEEVVDYALKKRDVELVSLEKISGYEGFTTYKGKVFDPSMTETRRFYPQTHSTEGFFVAKFVKKSDRKFD